MYSFELCPKPQFSLFSKVLYCKLVIKVTCQVMFIFYARNQRFWIFVLCASLICKANCAKSINVKWQCFNWCNTPLHSLVKNCFIDCLTQDNFTTTPHFQSKVCPIVNTKYIKSKLTIINTVASLATLSVKQTNTRDNLGEFLQLFLFVSFTQ